MKTAHTLTKKIVLTLLVGIAISLSHIDAAMSRDTDIYFTNPNAQQQAIKPNIMVIIDTSGSMVNNEVSPGVTRLQAMKDAFNAILDDPLTTNMKMGLMRFSGANAGPVLFPVADLDRCAIGPSTDPTCIEYGVVTVDTTMASSSDDAEETKSSGAILLTGVSFDMPYRGATEQVVGVRFQGVSVPRGATITGAYVVFEASGSSSGGTPPIIIKAQNSSDPATFTSTNYDVSTRTNATNAVGTSVTWSPVEDWTADVKYTSPDLKTIVQQLVNRSDWCGGSMLFTFEGGGAAITRAAKTYDTGSSGDFAQGAPILVIQYDPATVPAGSCVSKSLQIGISGNNDDAEETVSNGSMDRNDDTLDIIREGSNNQAVGLRFSSVAIPAGATITSAYIDFTIDSSNSSTANFSIVGQKSLTPGSFGSGNYNITSRVDTAAERTSAVSWPSVPNPSAGSTLTTPDLKTIVQELANQSGWTSGNPMVMVITGSGTRQVRSRDDTSSKQPILRITYQSTASATTVTTLTVRDRLSQIVNGLQASGSTPITDSLWEAGLYYRGQPVLYGKKRGDQSGTDAQYTRISHPASYTGGTALRDPSCTDVNLNASACVTEEIFGSPTYVTPFEEGCQNSYIVLLTDGYPTINNSVSLAETLTGTTCASALQQGECAKELAAYYANNDLGVLDDKHSVSTSVIGFGSDVTAQEAVDYLTDISTAGGGKFYAAGDATSLVTAFQGILADVNDAPTSFVSPSLSVNAFNKLFNRDEVYFSLFSPQKQVHWPGNIKKFKLCNDPTNNDCTFGEVLDANGEPAIDADSKIKSDPDASTSVWTQGTPDAPDGPTVQKGGAGQLIPDHAFGTRNVYTYTGTASTTDNDDLPANAEDLTLARHVVKQETVSSTLDNVALTRAMLGDSAMSDQRYYDIVNWMRGRDVNDKYPDNADGTKGNGNTTENRWRFTDALHSRPLTVSYGGTEAAPVIKIFVGTNDGGLRMLNADSGIEEWIVYIPEFLDDQGTLMDNASGTHFDGLDGTPTAYVIDNDGDGIIEPTNSDKVYLFISMRRGGRDLYAFDVTPNTVISSPSATGDIKPKFLWRIKGGTSTGFDDLGQTWSRPLQAKIRVKGATAGKSMLKNALFFAGGYDPRLDTPGANNVFPVGADTMGNAIYIVDPLDGSLIWRAGGAGSGANLQLTGMDYAIPSDLALLDTDSDGAVDRIYVGDSRGQVWRVDLGNQIDPTQANVANTTDGSGGYLFANISGTSRQDSRKFFYPPEIAQVTDTIYSSTPDYDLVVIASGDREDPLDKLTASVSTTEVPVNNRLYAFRDYNYQTGVMGTPPTALTETQLYDATNNNLGTFTGSTLQDEIDNNVKNKKGWYLSLRESPTSWIGEKGLAKATIFEGKILFTTFTPTGSTTASAGTCAPLSEGIGKLYALDYLNATAAFDLTGDGTLDRSAEVGKGIPSETVVVIRETGVTTLIGTSGGAARPDIELDMPRYNTYWYQE